jgi:hypothetical protein
MPGRHDHRVLPSIVGERDEPGVGLERIGGDADVGLAVEQDRRNLLRARLVQDEAHVRERLLEARDDGRQRVARLGVRGRDLEDALVSARQAPGDLREVLRLQQHAPDDLDRLLAGFREAEQPLAAAHEQLHAEFVLEVLDVLADARLRGQKRARHLGQIEVAARRLADDAKLLEVHAWPPLPAR